MLFIWMDGKIVAAYDIELMHDTKQMLQEKFNMNGLGTLIFSRN